VRAVWVAWLVASSLPGAPLAAQDATLAAANPAAAPALARGERVRLWLAGSSTHVGSRKKISGTVESVSPEALVVRPFEASASPVTLSRTQIDMLEVARGTRRRWPEGAAIGFVPGAVFGVAAGYALSCDDYNASCNGAAGAVVGLVLGAGTACLGALVGLAFKTDRWVSVPTRPKVALQLAPVKGGLRAAVIVRY